MILGEWVKFRQRNGQTAIAKVLSEDFDSGQLKVQLHTRSLSRSHPRYHPTTNYLSIPLRSVEWLDEPPTLFQRETADPCALGANTRHVATVEHRFVPNAATLEVPKGLLKEDGEFAAAAMLYNTKDSYNTMFTPGCFKESLASGNTVPVLYGHDSSRDINNLIGKVVDYHDSNAGLLTVGRLAIDDEAVPAARTAHALLKNGSLNGVSVGFVREDQKPGPHDTTLITKAHLAELSLVNTPAVPGARVLQVRSS